VFAIMQYNEQNKFIQNVPELCAISGRYQGQQTYKGNSASVPTHYNMEKYTR